MLDLFPMAMGDDKTQKVFVVDELDTGLHPAITYRFIQGFLESKACPRDQLIATTHETTVLDQDLIRRDEVWLVDKDNNGSTSFSTVESFRIRNDLDLQKAYLRGMFGGSPHTTTVSWALAEDRKWWMPTDKSRY